MKRNSLETHVVDRLFLSTDDSVLPLPLLTPDSRDGGQDGSIEARRPFECGRDPFDDRSGWNWGGEGEEGEGGEKEEGQEGGAHRGGSVVVG